MYTLYTDKATTFECKVELEGASLAHSSARVIIESGNKSYLFKGSVDENGDCHINIPKLKGILESGSRGNISLEVIVEDAYFNPWQSDCEVTTERALTVEVYTPKTKSTSKSIKVEVKTEQDKLIENFVGQLKKKGITTESITKNKQLIKRFMTESRLPLTALPIIVKQLAQE